MSDNNNNNQNNSTNTKKRDFILDGKIGEETTRKLAEEIININRMDDEEWEKDHKYVAKPINIYVNTYGGSVYDCNFLIGVMETSKTPIHTFCHGKAMSAGFSIYLAGHKRYATQLAYFMYHDASVGMHNTIEGLEVDLNHFKNLRNQNDSYILSKCNLPKEKMDLKKKLKEDLYLTAFEAWEYGIVHEIIVFPKRSVDKRQR